MLLGAITSRLRDLIRVQSLPERLAPAEAARQAGLRFDWQVRRYREQAKRFSLGGARRPPRTHHVGRPRAEVGGDRRRRPPDAGRGDRGGAGGPAGLGRYAEAAARFAALARRDLCRAAARLWSMPLEAALS